MNELMPVTVLSGRGAICREVIESLPEWFGLPASNEAYVVAAENLPMVAYFEPNGDVMGFISIKAHTASASELYVLGVKRNWHRRGIGRRLIEAAAQLAASQGARVPDGEDARPFPPRRELRRDAALLRSSRVPADRGISDLMERRQSMPSDAPASCVRRRAAAG
jgi:GNAT superfamily N-acetyltransferase